MKKTITLLVLCTVFAFSALAQNLTKLGVSTVKVKDFGEIVYDNEIRGYYFFYMLDKKTPGVDTYQLSVLDENLREVSSVEILRPKLSQLLEIAFNGQAFALLFLNGQGRSLEMVSYDKTLKNKNTIRKEEASSKEWFFLEELGLYGTIMPMENFRKKWLIPLKDTGFAFYIKTGRNAVMSYQLECFDNSLKSIWVKKAQRKESTMIGLENIFQDSKYVGSMTHSLLSIAIGKKIEPYNGEQILVHEKKTGNSIATIPVSDEKYHLKPTKVIYDSVAHVVDVFGDLYEKKIYYYTSRCIGMFKMSFDFSGKLLEKKLVEWQGWQGHYDLDEKGKTKEGDSFFVHETLKTNEGDVFLIGEEYRDMHPGSVAYNMIVLQFDSNFKLKKKYVFDKKQTAKKKSNKATNTYEDRSLAKTSQYKNFDYEFSNVTDRGNAFMVAYEEPVEDKKNNKYNILMYTPEKTFVTDKITAGNGKSEIFINRAKPGYILITEYFEKDKKLDMRLEKINY